MASKASAKQSESLLASLNSLKKQGSLWVSSVSLSNFLRDQKGTPIHWRTIDALFTEMKSLVTRRKRSGRWEYMILRDGVVAVEPTDDPISFVDPSSALQATMRLHDVLTRLNGTIYVCDPYLDESTIEHLQACQKNVPLNLLTMKVKDSGPLRRVIASAKTSGYQWEIRIVNAHVLHDRYIIDNNDMLILGTSLNGFGKKQSFVIKTGSDVRNLALSAFKANWAAATPFP